MGVPDSPDLPPLYSAVSLPPVVEPSLPAVGRGPPSSPSPCRGAMPRFALCLPWPAPPPARVGGGSRRAELGVLPASGVVPAVVVRMLCLVPRVAVLALAPRESPSPRGGDDARSRASAAAGGGAAGHRRGRSPCRRSVCLGVPAERGAPTGTPAPRVAAAPEPVRNVAWVPGAGGVRAAAACACASGGRRLSLTASGLARRCSGSAVRRPFPPPRWCRGTGVGRWRGRAGPPAARGPRAARARACASEAAECGWAGPWAGRRPGLGCGTAPGVCGRWDSRTRFSRWPGRAEAPFPLPPASRGPPRVCGSCPSLPGRVRPLGPSGPP